LGRWTRSHRTASKSWSKLCVEYNVPRIHDSSLPAGQELPLPRNNKHTKVGPLSFPALEPYPTRAIPDDRKRCHGWQEARRIHADTGPMEGLYACAEKVYLQCHRDSPRAGSKVGRGGGQLLCSAVTVPVAPRDVSHLADPSGPAGAISGAR
jgi:hypothetical protein